MEFNYQYNVDVTQKIGQRRNKRRSLEYKRNYNFENQKSKNEKKPFSPIKNEEEKKNIEID